MQAPKKKKNMTSWIKKGKQHFKWKEEHTLGGFERGSYYDEGFGQKHPIWAPPLVDSRLKLFAGPALGAASSAGHSGIFGVEDQVYDAEFFFFLIFNLYA